MSQPINWSCVLLSLLCGSGCTAISLPPRLTDVDQVSLESRHIPLDVGLTSTDPSRINPVWLTSALGAVGIFDRVDSLDAYDEHPDLIAEVDYVSRLPLIAVTPIFTLGLVPCVMTEPYGVRMSFSAPRRPSRIIRVEYTYQQTVVVGGLGTLLNPWPGWVQEVQLTNERVCDNLALRILEREQELVELAR